MNVFFNEMIPPNFMAVPGLWIFRMCTSSLLPHGCSSKACRMACSRSKSSYVNLMSTLIGTFYWCGEEKQARSWVTIPGILGWPKRLGFSVISYGKNPNDLFGQPCIMMVCLMGVLESSTAVPPVRRKIDLSFSGNLLEAPFQELNDIIYMK